MAEKYMKEIMDKLEEIEKLHAKLRSMVPRMKNHETGSSSASDDRETSKPKKKKDPAAEREKERKTSWKQKVSQTGIEMEKVQGSRGSKYLKKLRNSSASHVADATKRIKNFLAGLFERDIIFVSRAAQTSDSGVSEATMSGAVSTGNENNEFPWKEMRYKKNRVSAPEQLKRLLEHFNYARDSSPRIGSGASIHDDNSGIREPRRVRKRSTLLPAEEETSRILSAARTVPIDDTERNSDLASQVRDFVRKYSSQLR
nr:uncharacterized protein LOC117222344 [Megalopta genalis]